MLTNFDKRKVRKKIVKRMLNTDILTDIKKISCIYLEIKYYGLQMPIDKVCYVTMPNCKCSAQILHLILYEITTNHEIS